MASMDYGLDPGFEPKHIDRKSLHTNLEARINYLKYFLDFNAADVEALASGAKYLKQLIPAVVNLVYKKLLQCDITSRAFHTGSTVDESPLNKDYLDEETPQIKRRKMFLRWYLIRLCQDPTSMDFWRYLNKVAMMHSGQERMHSLNIEHIHINACMAYIQDIMIEALMSHPSISWRGKIALLRAINKILMIQLDLFAKWRLRDGEEFADEMSLYSVGSREGYIGDQKILGSSDGSSVDGDRASISDSIGQSVSSTTPTESVRTMHTAHTTGSSTLNRTQTGGSTSTLNRGMSQRSACPFAMMGKAPGTGTETKIWAN